MEQENKNYYKFTIITTKKRQNCSMNIEKKRRSVPKLQYNIDQKRKLLRNTMYIEKENKLFGIFDQISHGRHSFSKKNPMKIKNTAEEVFFRITENFLEEG